MSANSTIAPAQAPSDLDLDGFEVAILDDLLSEWTKGANCIPSIPVELASQVRFDLIRFEAWMRLEHEPLLFLLFQHHDYQAYANMKTYCQQYTRFRNVALLNIDDAEFTTAFAAACRTRKKIAVCLPTEAFPTVTGDQLQTNLFPNVPPWTQYAFLVANLPPMAYWPVMGFLGGGESALLRAPLSYISVALVLDRCR